MSKKEAMKFVDISTMIKKNISEVANSEAVDALVAKLKDAEVAKRADLLEKGYNLWKTTENELKKCVEDVTQHVPVSGADGEFVQQKSFSDAKFKERKTLKERQANLEVALMKALGEDQDYAKLDEIVKKNPAKDNKKGNDNKTEE
jgi:hypothetical protein